MGLSLNPKHLKRYKDVAALLIKHGRGTCSKAPRSSTIPSPSNLLTGLLEAKEFIERLPARLNDLLDPLPPRQQPATACFQAVSDRIDRVRDDSALVLPDRRRGR